VGPAHAINKGFSEAKGEIVAWLNADDMYADEALWEAGKAFAEDPELDMIFANALYIDENDRLFLADHGTYRTGLYYGEIQPKKRIPAYWKYIHALPQPTVFFRRSLLDSCGNLDEKYQFIFDFELFFRFVGTAKIKKIERTMAFYRIHSAAKTSNWSNFEVELYRFSRKLWPRLRDSEFRFVHRDFVANFMRRNFNWLPRGFRFWSVAAIVSLFAATRMGNPEKLKRYFSPPPPPQNPVLPSRSLIMQPSIDQSVLPAGSGFAPASRAHNITINRKSQRYHTVFCSYTWPRHPGYSGGEIRDFQLVRHLLKMSTVEFFAQYDYLSDGRDDLLLPFVDKLHTPNAARSDLVHQQSLLLRLKHRLLSNLRLKNVPVFGSRYHNDAASRFHMISAYTLATLNKRLSQKPPDFLFVSPQSNPVAMMLNMAGIDARLIMASYDVEAVRMRRFAASQSGIAKLALALEAKRAKRFEKENLAFYDGIIAVSDLDKDIFVNEYGFPPERVVVIDNGVDSGYFAFTERQPVERPEIVYTGSFSYLPNQQAAWRLIRGIMPIVWKKYPEARLWIVGQQPGPKLEAQSDGKRIVVTGRVEDIRPYLAGASVGCVPLSAGSGTKYKVLEALSVGMSLVCTPLSIEGLELEDGKHLLLGDDDKELAAALMRLLEQPELVKEITGQGNDWVKQRYAWDVILPRMDGWLDALRAMPLRRDGSK
jgi:glycosyltransferase involved in cell wall biosynthesis/GT2 family glycosyltransferase